MAVKIPVIYGNPYIHLFPPSSSEQNASKTLVPGSESITRKARRGYQIILNSAILKGTPKKGLESSGH